nr:hypothetical protein [Tanacetum cinerariifolium]
MSKLRRASNTRVQKSEKSEKVGENKANVRGEKSQKNDKMKAKTVKDVEKSEASMDSVIKVSEIVKMFERFKSKSSAGLRASNGGESEESGGRLSFGGSSGKVNKGSNCTLDGSGVKYPSKLHGKMLSDIQETVAGIEKAMGDVVKKKSPVKEGIKEYSSDVKSSAKAGLNNDELEARLFPHHKLLRDRTTLAKVAVTVIETKPDEKPLSDVVENCVHLQELEQAAKSKNYALMWVVKMEREVANDNQITRKLLDVVKDVDKSLKKRQRIIDELKVKKGMRAWKAVTFYREVEHQEMEMRQQLMLHIN